MTSPTSNKPTFSFRPLPLLGNPHVQTVLGSWIRGKVCPAPEISHVIGLPDGDGVLLHENRPPGWKEGERIALLVHGLGGSHTSPHIMRMGARLFTENIRVFRMDLRGAGQSAHLSRKSYHGGRSDDLRVCLEWIHNIAPTSRLLLIGVSLGGNIVLKLAGESAAHPVAGLARVATIAPPIDLALGRTIRHPRNRMYERMFLDILIRMVRERERRFPDLPKVDFPNQMTIRKFDDLFTAPINGFADAPDYYKRASSMPLIPHIPVPTLIVTSRDDPFIAVEPYEELRVPDHIHIGIVNHGGHVGFLGWDGAGGIRWAERQAVDWVLRD